jgi:hypothetical protein
MTLGKIETARAQCIFVFQKPPAPSTGVLERPDQW